MYSCRYRAKPVHDLWQKTGSPSCHRVESRDTLGDHVGAESLVESHGSLCAADSCQGVIHVPTPHTVEHHCPQWLAVHCPILWSVNSTRLAGHKIPLSLSLLPPSYLQSRSSTGLLDGEVAPHKLEDPRHPSQLCLGEATVDAFLNILLVSRDCTAVGNYHSIPCSPYHTHLCSRKCWA